MNKRDTKYFLFRQPLVYTENVIGLHQPYCWFAPNILEVYIIGDETGSKLLLSGVTLWLLDPLYLNQSILPSKIDIYFNNYNQGSNVRKSNHSLGNQIHRT